MNQIAVVILNYNGQKHLADFLPSVIEYSPNATIYVADNASTDNSLTFLKTNFPSVQVIELKENHGFAQGYNEALKHVNAEYYVLLNSDVEVTPNWIEPIFLLMENDKTIAACQPKIRAFHQKSHFEYAGAAGGFIDHLGYPFCRGRIFQELEADLNQFDDTIEVFWATGACMFVRSEVFHSVGGFDGDFFAHMEEIDLCWRIHHAGHKVYACGKSIVFHVGGGTLHKSNPYKTFLNFRNGLAMLYKNHPDEGFAIAIFTRLVLDGVAGIKFLLFDTWQDCWAVARAHFDFYANFPSWNKKRRQIQRRNKISTIYKRNIVWEHFVNKVNLFENLRK